MKTSNIFALLAVIAFLSGCKSRPEACFDIDQPEWIVANRMLQFSDCSLRGDSWYWDFGDGTSSTDRHPKKAYDRPGTYKVTEVVTKDDKADSISVELEVKQAYFKSLSILKVPETRPNGMPWDPDLSGPDVYFNGYYSGFLPGLPDYGSPNVYNIQTQLPYTHDVEDAEIAAWGVGWSFVLVCFSAGSDTITRWGDYIENLIDSPIYTREFGDSLGFQFEFYAK